VDQVPRRMVGEEVAAALPAPLAPAVRRLVVLADTRGTFRDLDGGRLPQRESIDRAGRPTPAGLTMAVAHACGLAGDAELHGSAGAFAFVRLLLGHGATFLSGRVVEA